MRTSTAKNKQGIQSKWCTRTTISRERSKKAAYCKFLKKQRSLISGVAHSGGLPERDPLASRRNLGMKSEHKGNSQKDGDNCMGVFVVVGS
jgi:hypothetical protein